MGEKATLSLTLLHTHTRACTCTLNVCKVGEAPQRLRFYTRAAETVHMASRPWQQLGPAWIVAPRLGRGHTLSSARCQLTSSFIALVNPVFLLFFFFGDRD